MSAPPSSYSSEIYLRGTAGERPPFTTVPDELEAAARAALDAKPFWYVAGSAGSGATSRANRAALDRWRIVPRMLTGATERELATTVLGSSLAAPVITSPIGVQSIVHDDAERAAARVTAELGIGMALSTVSSPGASSGQALAAMEDVAAENVGGVRWFQLYWPNDESVTVSLLERAAAAGYSALLVTLDTWMLGWRPHDLDNTYLPFLTGAGLANYFSDPAFCALLDRSPAEDLPAAVARWLPVFTGTDHTWDQLAFLRAHWPGPIAVKGIQAVDDARRAVDAGMDGVLVSNHGGRQVDGAIGALEALPAIVDAVGAQVDVLFDSGGSAARIGDT